MLVTELVYNALRYILKAQCFIHFLKNNEFGHTSFQKDIDNYMFTVTVPDALYSSIIIFSEIKK